MRDAAGSIYASFPQDSVGWGSGFFNIVRLIRGEQGTEEFMCETYRIFPIKNLGRLFSNALQRVHVVIRTQSE